MAETEPWKYPEGDDGAVTEDDLTYMASLIFKMRDEEEERAAKAGEERQKRDSSGR